MNQAGYVILGLLIAAVTALITGGFVHKRTAAETARAGSEAGHHDADAALAMAQAAGVLMPLYQTQIDSLSTRLAAAEAETAFTRRLAMSSREAEQRCLDRLDKMQARLASAESQITALQELIAHPASSTTVTTAVTTHDPAVPVVEP